MQHVTEAIIFDKDGTLFDFRATWSVWAERMLDTLSEGDAGRRLAVAEVMGFTSGTGFLPESVVIAGTPGEIGAALADVSPRGAAEIIHLANAIAMETPQVAVAELSETLQKLSATHVLGCVTNDAIAPAEAHLEQAGIAGHFSFVAGFDSGYRAKPAPDPLLAFCVETGTRAATTLMVGDSRHDLEAGRAAGMTTVAVLTGVATAADLADLADATLLDISHLPDWIAARG